MTHPAAISPHVFRRAHGPGAGDPVVIALDVDWAPDWMIADAADRLIAAGAKAAWFITHDTPALDRLRDRPDLFELGLHPNVARDSSHGETLDDAMATLRAIEPDATTVRTHGLRQSTQMLIDLAGDHGATCDVSLVVHGVGPIPVHWFRFAGERMLRLPCTWEDDFHFHDPPADRNWRPDVPNGTGPITVAFHPVHLALNSSSPAAYDALRAAGPLATWTRADVTPHRSEAPGASTAFDHVLAAAHARTALPRELYAAAETADRAR